MNKGMKVWILTDEWVQDLEHGLTVAVYSRLSDAVEHMEEVIAENHSNGIEYGTEERPDDLHYVGYYQGDYNSCHTSISIELMEVH